MLGREKRRLSNFLRKWGWFHGHDEGFPKNLGSESNFLKTETRLCWWKKQWSLGNPCTLLLEKKRPEKILHNAAEKQSMPFKDIWCYLAIGCFDWKIDVFQQAVLRVYYILNQTILLFWNNFVQKGYFPSKIRQINITIEFTMFKLIQVPTFILYRYFQYFRPNLFQKDISTQ